MRSSFLLIAFATFTLAVALPLTSKNAEKLNSLKRTKRTAESSLASMNAKTNVVADTSKLAGIKKREAPIYEEINGLPIDDVVKRHNPSDVMEEENGLQTAKRAGEDQSKEVQEIKGLEKSKEADENKAKEDDSADGEAAAAKPAASSEEATAHLDRSSNSKEELPANSWLQYPYMDPAYRQKRHLPQSQNSIVALTAEGMNQNHAAAPAVNRVKRDLTLTPEDIKYLLSHGDEAIDNWKRYRANFLDEENGQLVIPSRYRTREDSPYEDEGSDPVFEEDPYTNKRAAPWEEREDYYPPYGVDKREFNPEELYEPNYQRENMPRESQDLKYDVIVHEGVPGVFFPISKREYLSMMPGIRKRDFYPSSLEPQGHWGGLVPPSNRAANYENVLRLAERLREPDNDYWRDVRRK